MNPALFPVYDDRNRMMYISLRYKSAASDLFIAIKDMQWTSYDYEVVEFKRNLNNLHVRDNAIRKIEKAVQRSSQKTADFVAYMDAQLFEAQLTPDNLWPSIRATVPTATRKYLSCTRAYQRHDGLPTGEACF